MTGPQKSLLLLVCIAIGVGLAEPPLEVAWKCRAGFETSEACVWGKSYLPLARALGLLVITPVTFGILLVSRLFWQTVVGRSRPPL